MRRLFAALLILMTALSVAPSAMAQPHWRPSMQDSFDWQYNQPFDFRRLTSTINLDAFDADPAFLESLRARGVRPICYVNVGAWEDWRPDKHTFPKSIIGKAYVGWEGERWLDIRRMKTVLPIMRARFRLCREKGFFAIEVDNIDNFQQDTGFKITRAHQLRYNRALAKEAHSVGLAIAMKNAPEFAAELADVYDWVIAEDCFKWKWCGMMTPFILRGKPVVTIEYPENGRKPLSHCEEARRLGIQIVVKRRRLDGWSRRCP